MFTTQVIVNEERESLPRAVALKVEVSLKGDDKGYLPENFVKNLMEALESLILAPVSVAIAVSPSNRYVLILSELGNVSPSFANTLMFTAAEVTATDFGVKNDEIEVRFGPLHIQPNWL